ncbi:retrovirus-related pol polyprotein from transposon TNT 1-94 [Tanacetum coccineum]
MPTQRNNARGNGVAGNVGGQNRGGMINPGQAKPIKCYNCNRLGHIARKGLPTLIDVDDTPRMMLALNVDHSFEAMNEMHSTLMVDGVPHFTTMFHEVKHSPHLKIQSTMKPGHHKTRIIHLSYVVDSDADYTSDSNIIPYDQYVEDNEEHVVQSDVSSVQNDALMSILDEMHEQSVQSMSANKQDMVVNDSVTSELARYKELVGEYEKRAKFELTDRERKNVQTALFKEVKVMEEIFDQINNEVDKNTVDKQCAEIVKKNLLIENENLIANCLSNQLLYDVEKSRCLDLEADMSKEAPDFNSFFKIKNLEHQIQEKDNVIRDLKVLVANVNDRSCEPYNAKDVTALIEQK